MTGDAGDARGWKPPRKWEPHGEPAIPARDEQRKGEAVAGDARTEAERIVHWFRAELEREGGLATCRDPLVAALAAAIEETDAEDAVDVLKVSPRKHGKVTAVRRLDSARQSRPCRSVCAAGSGRGGTRMSSYGRLRELMAEALISAPDPLHGDQPGPLADVDAETARDAVVRACEVAWAWCGPHDTEGTA